MKQAKAPIPPNVFLNVRECQALEALVRYARGESTANGRTGKFLAKLAAKLAAVRWSP